MFQYRNGKVQRSNAGGIAMLLATMLVFQSRNGKVQQQ